MKPNSLTIALLLSAAPVMAAETPAAPTTAAAPPASAALTAPSIIVESAAPVIKVSGPEPEKLICRKEVVIGSLIAKRRVCATQRNWDRNTKQAQDNLQEFTKPGAFSPNG